MLLVNLYIFIPYNSATKRPVQLVATVVTPPEAVIRTLLDEAAPILTALLFVVNVAVGVALIVVLSK